MFATPGVCVSHCGSFWELIHLNACSLLHLMLVFHIPGDSQQLETCTPGQIGTITVRQVNEALKRNSWFK